VELPGKNLVQNRIHTNNNNFFYFNVSIIRFVSRRQVWSVPKQVKRVHSLFLFISPFVFYSVNYVRVKSKKNIYTHTNAKVPFAFHIQYRYHWFQEISRNIIEIMNYKYSVDHTHMNSIKPVYQKKPYYTIFLYFFELTSPSVFFFARLFHKKNSAFMLIYMISSSESLYFFYSLAAPVLSATSKLKKHRNLIKLNKKHLTHLQTLLSGVRKTSVFG